MKYIYNRDYQKSAKCIAERWITEKKLTKNKYTWHLKMYSLAFSLSMPLQSSNIKQMAADTSISYRNIISL